MIDLDELKKLIEEVGADEWKFGEGYEYLIIGQDGDTVASTGSPVAKGTRARARYIAAANPQAVRELIARVEALEELLRTIYGWSGTTAMEDWQRVNAWRQAVNALMPDTKGL